MQKNMLRSKMALFGDNDGTLSAYLGINRSTFSAKLNETGGREFTQSEIAKIKLRYNLSAEEINDIFFSQKVS